MIPATASDFATYTKAAFAAWPAQEVLVCRPLLRLAFGQRVQFP